MKIHIIIQLRFGKFDFIKLTVSEDELRNTYGCYYENPKEGDSWNVIWKVSGSAWMYDYTKGERFLDIRINEIYTGPDNNEEDYKYGKSISDDDGKIIDGDTAPTPSEAASDIIEGIGKTVITFKDNFEKNKLGTILSYLLDFFKMCWGDAPQFVINMIQTSNAHNFYTKNELLNDGEDGDVNKYTQVSNYKATSAKEWQQEIDVNMNGEDDVRFDVETEIPVVIADVYNMAIGHIDFFDINFLTGNAHHDSGSPWSILRDIAASFIHVSLYLSSMILIIILIITGIRIVFNNFKTPEENVKVKEQLEKFGTSVAMLVGTVIIMSLCIFGVGAVFESLEQRTTYELPIRVNVQAANYSFSTTPTGYVSYMASNQDVNQYAEKGIFVATYILLVWINVFMMAVMFIRMLGLWLLSIVGPITAALSIFNVEGSINFNKWVNLYISFSFIQIFVAIIYKIILQCAIK